VRVRPQVQALPRCASASQRLNETGKVVHVVAAVLTDSRGRILIAQRPPGSHLAGGWEFPGGKLESGESPLAGLARELREELGIEMGSGPHRPLRRVRHSYSDREILIEVWMLQDYTGDPRGLDNQAIRWCRQEELAGVPMLPADAPIVEALRLPDRLVCASTSAYVIGPPSPGKLAGAICGDSKAAQAAEGRGADFIAMDVWIPDEALSDLCSVISIPIYALGVSLGAAWVLGATGVNQLTAT
jgi:mutator protein MutT